jgi:hypothetical protein
MIKKKTLVLGASPNSQRYSNLAVIRLRNLGHEVIAIGAREGNIADITIGTEKFPIEKLDTVTLYLNPARQKDYYDYLLSLNPKRIIFNPGTENDELKALAVSKGIETEEACTLVMLSTGEY